MAEGFVETATGRLWFQESGDPERPTVAFVHSGLVDSRMWDREMNVFSDRYRTVRFDLPGFGRSDPPSGRFSPVETVLAVLAHAGAERAAIVGSSMGGSIAIDVALERPDAVSALVLAASGVGGFSFGPDLVHLWTEVDEAVAAGDLARAQGLELDFWCPPGRDEATDRLIRDLARENVAAMTMDDSLAIGVDRPALERLGDLSAPTLVMSGELDAQDMGSIAELLAERIPGARRVPFPGAHHLINLAEPEAFGQEVLAFLEDVLPG